MAYSGQCGGDDGPYREHAVGRPRSVENLAEANEWDLVWITHASTLSTPRSPRLVTVMVGSRISALHNCLMRWAVSALPLGWWDQRPYPYRLRLLNSGLGGEK
jgi:hypothetical protein